MAGRADAVEPDDHSPRSRRCRAPVTRPAPLRTAVIDALVEMIVSRELLPGERLIEAELAELLGVSRQPIREAFQQLHAEGWIDQVTGMGAFVHVPTEKEARDLLHVRTVLESEAARLAAVLRDSADISDLRQICALGRKAARDNDIDRIVAVNAQLHARIQTVADNSVLTNMNRTVEARVRWFHTPIAEIRGEASWAEHEEIIDAIEAGDAERAGMLMVQHTSRTRTMSLELGDSANPGDQT